MFGKLLEKESHPHYDTILLILRIALGVVFVAYGLKHVIGIDGFMVAFDEKFNFVMPYTLAVISAWTELLGGLAVLLGVFTRIGAAFIAVNMVVAALFVRIPQVIAEADPALGLAGIWDKDLVYTAVAIVLIIANAGAYSLARKLPEGNLIRRL